MSIRSERAQHTMHMLMGIQYACTWHTMRMRIGRPARAMRVSYQGITSVIHCTNLYMYLYDVLSFSYLDWDSNHQLLVYENLVISTRPSCHLTYCKNFTYINVKDASRIRRECALCASQFVTRSHCACAANADFVRFCELRYKVALRMPCECALCAPYSPRIEECHE